MRSLLSFGTLLLIVCGAVAGWLVSRIVPDGLRHGAADLRSDAYTGNWENEPFLVNDARRLEVPWLFADFDLQMDVELGEGVTLDLIVRRVEPRLVGQRFEQFHGRFVALRLSAGRGGDPWFTRERLLLGARDAPGVEVAPGHPATVWLAGRGRRLEANVAGRLLPAFAADDEYGSVLLVARGGTAALNGFSIKPRGQQWALLWSPWFWLGLGALVGLAVRVAGVALRLRAGVSAALLVLTTWFLVELLAEQEATLRYPPAPTLFAVLAAGACIATCLRARLRLPGLAVAAALVYFAPRLGLDEHALDEVFGPAAGSTLAESHAQLVRGPYMLHDVRPVERRVFLLGGQLLYGPGAPDQHLEALLAGDLRVALQQRVDVPCLPTVDGWTTQQWGLFTRYFTNFRPDVIVLGVPTDEGAIDPATGRPRSWPGDVQRTIAAAREHCSRVEARLVLFAGAGLPKDYLAVLEEESKRGTPLVVAREQEAPAALSRRLTDVLVPMLR